MLNALENCSVIGFRQGNRTVLFAYLKDLTCLKKMCIEAAAKVRKCQCYQSDNHHRGRAHIQITLEGKVARFRWI